MAKGLNKARILEERVVLVGGDGSLYRDGIIENIKIIKVGGRVPRECRGLQVPEPDRARTGDKYRQMKAINGSGGTISRWVYFY